jgi:hypothetical protein
MTDPDPQEVEDWWKDWIDSVRSDEAALQHIDASEPCQVEVFWLRDDIEGQVSVIMHNRDKGDKEILVHGPFEGHEFVEKVGDVAREDRWQERHPMGRSPPGQPFETKADSLAGLIARFIDEVQGSIFSDLSSFRNHLLGGHRLWGSAFGQFNLGNVTDFETDGSLTDQEETEDEECEEEEDSQEDQSDEETEDTDSDNDDIPDGGSGGYIYPPVWIERAPEKTFEQKVWDSEEFGYDVIFSQEFLDGEIIAIRDGLLLLTIEDRDKIRNILNTIFGVATFFRRRWRSLQGEELVSAAITERGVMNTSARLSTRRAQLLNSEDLPEHIERGAISAHNLQHILDVAEEIYQEDGLKEKVILHLQAYTHLLDHEYTASFLLNWNIIEQQILDILNPHLRDNYNVNSERRRNMERGSHWSISHMLEVAEITDAITNSQYNQLDDFRSKRNDIVHKMETASEEQAEDLNDLVSDFLEREVDEALADSDS